jgi:hypothetical protein
MLGLSVFGAGGGGFGRGFLALGTAVRERSEAARVGRAVTRVRAAAS